MSPVYLFLSRCLRATPGSADGLHRKWFRGPKWLLLVLCLGICLSSAAQKTSKTPAKKTTAQPSKTKAQLEREKKANLQKIQETARILEQTKAQKEASVGQLNALKEKISVQTVVIGTITKEVNYLDSEVQKTESVVNALQSDLEELKKEYAAMIYAASKSSSQAHKLMFLFAAESFNQFRRRLHYLRQYSEVRKQQVTQIEKVQQTLNAQLADLSDKRNQKKKLLQTRVKENQNLMGLKKEQDQVITKLSQREQELQRDLKEKQAAVKKLETLINDIVREEIRRAAEAARKEAAKTGTKSPAAATSPNRIALTPEAAMLSSSFAGNKSRLIWPVAKGFISQRFGKHAHPVLKNVVVENLGIDIQTNAGEPVRAVFNGTVATKAFIQGMGNVVMVQHGEYFTVYANLRSTNVNTGQKVNAKDQIGTVGTDSDNVSLLKFFIWKGNNKLDPEAWLYKK